MFEVMVQRVNFMYFKRAKIRYKCYLSMMSHLLERKGLPRDKFLVHEVKTYFPLVDLGRLGTEY